MTLPNFLVIGATKAGTTSIYEYLDQHPDVFMPTRIKEPRFFCYEGRETGFHFPVKTRTAYEALFAEAGPARAIGEATPHYLSFPGAPARIRATIPEARLIASLRNPVDRAYSLYQMNLREKGHNADRPFAQALLEDRWLKETYAENVARYLDTFPRDQLLILLFDDLVRDTGATMRGVLDFLGVDAEVELDVSRAANPGGLPRYPALHRLATSRAARGMGGVLPEALKRPLRDLRSRNLQKRPMAQEDRAAAAAAFREDILRTQDLIDRDLSAWLA